MNNKLRLSIALLIYLAVLESVAQTAYITNANDNTVSVIDLTDNSIITTISVGSGPVGTIISPDQTKVYVTNTNDSSISVINTATNTVENTITTGSDPFGIAISPDGNTLYVSRRGGWTSVEVIDANTGMLSQTLTVSEGPQGLELSSDGSTLYVTSNVLIGPDIFTIIDLSSGMSNTVSGINFPYSVVTNSIDTKLYITSAASDELVVLDPNTNMIINRISVGDGPTGLAISDDNMTAYVANSIDGTISVINLNTEMLTNTITVGADPLGLDFSIDGQFLYVTNNNSATVSVINVSTEMVVATINVGVAPSSFGDFVVNNEFVPVGLVDFQAVELAIGEKICVQWYTESELQNKGFEVQRSQNGKDWEYQVFVKGNGTSLEQHHYKWIDEAPLIGMNYYRLKQFDIDGSFEYSLIASVRVSDQNPKLNIHTNPVHHQLIYNVTSIKHQEHKAKIYQLNGQLLESWSSTNEKYTLDIQHIQAGTYILVVIIDGKILLQPWQKF